MILLSPETLVGFGISSMAGTFSGSGLRPLLVIKCPINLTSFIFKIFSVVDAKNGFGHVELDDESSYLTTFNTPFGRYRWLRMPFGISSAPEEYKRRQDQTVEGLPGVRSIIDDILISLLVIKCPINLTSFIFKESLSLFSFRFRSLQRSIKNHDNALDEMKRLVTAKPVLKYYDPKLQLVLQSDASETGLGVTIMQENQPIAYASRALTYTETHCH
jgi:hypothetical protein